MVYGYRDPQRLSIFINILVADALKLLLKEYVAPTQSNIILFFLGAL
jgi:NADH:ubiquinone oxidoreductase subunit H